MWLFVVLEHASLRLQTFVRKATNIRFDFMGTLTYFKDCLVFNDSNCVSEMLVWGGAALS